MRSLVPLVAASALLFVPSLAPAQSHMERAERHFTEAHFGEALRELDLAEREDELTRDQVIALLGARATARYALRVRDGVRTDLLALLTLDPSAELGAEAPPSLRSQLSRLRREVSGPLRVASRATAVPDGFRIEASVLDDLVTLAREVRVHHRADGGAWASAEGREAVLVVGQGVEWYAEVVGPGGAVLATDGTRAEPRREGRAFAVAEAAEPPPVDLTVREPEVASGGSDDTLAIVLGIGGGVLAVAAAVLIAVFLTMDDANASLSVSPPMMR